MGGRQDNEGIRIEQGECGPCRYFHGKMINAKRIESENMCGVWTIVYATVRWKVDGSLKGELGLFEWS